MLMVYYSPGGVKPEQAMIYASSQPTIVKESGVTKVYEIRDLDDFTEGQYPAHVLVFETCPARTRTTSPTVYPCSWLTHAYRFVLTSLPQNG